MTWDTLTKRFMEIVQDMASGQTAFSKEDIRAGELTALEADFSFLIDDARAEIKGETK